jgi:hypothetical protein
MGDPFSYISLASNMNNQFLKHHATKMVRLLCDSDQMHFHALA